MHTYIMFTADLSDLKRLERFFKKMPQELPRSTANVLNGLAFEARKTDIDILKQHLIIRNPGFLNKSIQYKKTAPVRIEQQIALVGSVKRERFTGWAEQEHGEVPKRRRAETLASRGGSKRNVIKSKARLHPKNKFFKPDQFRGKTIQQRFYFMMRVLGSRGGQNIFLVSHSIKFKRKLPLNRGLYSFAHHKIVRLQSFDAAKRIERLPWTEMMIRKLHTRRDVQRLWGDQVDRLIKRGYKI